MTHHKTSLPCAYLGLCLCLFSIQLNDCKTPNVSRRLKAEGISLLNPAACSQSFPQQFWSSILNPVWVWFHILGSSHGQDNGHRHEHGNVLVFFFCAVHQTPENGSWQFWKWLLVCFKRSQGRLSSSALKGTGSLGEGWPGTRGGFLLKAAFLLPPKTTQSLKKHFHHPVKERLCFCCESFHWSEQLHHIPVLFWEEKCISNSNFQTAPSHTLWGLLLRIKIAVSFGLPDSNPSCLRSSFFLLEEFIVWGTFRPGWGWFPSAEYPRDKRIEGALGQTLPSAEPSSSPSLPKLLEHFWGQGLAYECVVLVILPFQHRNGSFPLWRKGVQFISKDFNYWAGWDSHVLQPG